MNARTPSMAQPHACRLMRLIARSAWLTSLTLLTASPVPAQNPPGAAPSATLVTANRCPIQLAQLRPLRGFKLDMTFAEFMKSFRGVPPLLEGPNYLGVRSAKFYWSEERPSQSLISSSCSPLWKIDSASPSGS
jgi:hypothetical protein